MSARFLVIDEEGYFSLDGIRVTDPEIGRQWLQDMRIDDRGRARVAIENSDCYIEAFDQPLVATDVEPGPSADEWAAKFAYGYETSINPQRFRVDEWDRFHGYTKNEIPFVFSRSAQSRLFQKVDSYDDDSITFGGKVIAVKPMFNASDLAPKPAWWSELYQTGEKPWDVGAAHPLLDTLVPPLKMNRSRVLVLGCGAGHDAAWWHKRGHIVTAVDFSEEAIREAKAKYGEPQDLRWVVADAFKLPPEWTGSFDIVFEHTFFCAVSPERREEVVQLWRRMLSERGRLISIAFVMDKPFGPPFGATEWEFRQRLLLPNRPSKTARFRPLIWLRERESMPKRLGQELFFVVERGD